MKVASIMTGRQGTVVLMKMEGKDQMQAALFHVRRVLLLFLITALLVEFMSLLSSLATESI